MTKPTNNEPQYDEDITDAHAGLVEIHRATMREPKPANPIDGFRRWKMLNLYSRWAAAQEAGSHELAITHVNSDGSESWVCTCGLLVPATRIKFDEAAFLAAPGHRAMPEAPDWDPSMDEDLVDEDDSTTATQGDSTRQGEQ